VLEAVEMAAPEPAAGEVVIRVAAAGICHSDAHYRAGDPATRVLPITLGHEIAGTVVATGRGIDPGWAGRRVAVHYVVSDGVCGRCRRFGEQFCENYEMLGMTRDGGYAEAIAVPVANAVPVPDEVSLEHAAVMMCSSATSLHALRKGRLQQGESVAVFGVGGLGMSAIQLAFALGARRVSAVDIDDARLEMAARFGALPVPASEDPAAAIRTAGGADVALALVGDSKVFATAMASLGTRGRLVAVGIGREPVPVAPYGDLILGEHELIGSNDHTLEEIHELFAFAEQGRLQLDDIVTDRIPLDADSVNGALDRLDGFGPGIRTVITPGS
jgi:D-arabinose 1-dehydrogenase-like Zn-dependent alcohol dehydrogenase